MLKTLIASFLVSSSALAAPCGQAEQKHLDQVTARFENEGTATRTDVALAKLKLNDALKACGAIDQSTFCATAISNSEILVTGMIEEPMIGQRTEDEVADAQAIQSKYENQCR